MGMFDSAQEKERERKYEEAVSRILFFPGSIAEYELFRGYEVQIIDTQSECKGVFMARGDGSNYIQNKELRNHLIDKNIEAIVNDTFYPFVGQVLNYDSFYPFIGKVLHYGLPVCKKKEQ